MERIFASNYPDTAGADRRLRLVDRVWTQFFSSFTSTPSDDNKPEIEVQGFLSSQYGNYENLPVVMLVIRTDNGYGDVTLSADEARKVAEFLTISANEADVLSHKRPA